MGQKIVTELYDKMKKDRIRTLLFIFIYKLINPNMLGIYADYEGDNYN